MQFRQQDFLQSARILGYLAKLNMAPDCTDARLAFRSVKSVRSVADERDDVHPWSLNVATDCTDDTVAKISFPIEG